MSTEQIAPARAIRNALERLRRLAEIGACSLQHVQEEEALVDRFLREDAQQRKAAARALRAAIGCWSPFGRPGGGGADDDTYLLCLRAAEELEATL
jgi:hypothetical protein